MNENTVNEAESIFDETNVPDQDQNGMKEIIIGIPPNTAMMKISVLLVKENGETEEQSGQFNFEQILMSRMKYIQLMDKVKNGSDGTDQETGETSARSGGEEGASSKEEKGEVEEGCSESRQDS